MGRRRGGRQRRFRTPIEGRIVSLSAQGLGLIDAQGERKRPAGVVGALPGEQVQATLHERRGELDLALLERSDGSHPRRVDPPCPHFLDCSGCVLQHLQSDAQVETKESWLRDWVAQAGLEVQSWCPPLRGPTQGYRRKARLAVRWVEKKGRALVGFRELRDGRFVADLQQCAILDPAFSGLIPALCELIASLSIAAKVAQVEIAAGDRAAGLVFRVLEPPTPEDLRKLQAFEADRPWKVWLQPGGMQTIATLDGELLAQREPELVYALDDGALELAFGPDNFIQVNRAVNEQMVARAMEWLAVTREDTVLDLFCGLGNFTLPLARRAGQVIGVEADAALIERARANAQRNALHNVSFDQQDLYAPELTGRWADVGATKVLLDPPRSGAGPVIEILARSAVQRIVYVACGPTAMIADLRVLRDAGFEIRALGILDMFPHTAHFESMALLERSARGCAISPASSA